VQRNQEKRAASREQAAILVHLALDTPQDQGTEQRAEEAAELARDSEQSKDESR
jgi:hypothetical protein